MRLLEQFCIMKPSQSATERVMSHVANTVKDRFESKISPYTTDELKIDSVNLKVLLKCNANMVSLDKTAARHIFQMKYVASGVMKSKSSIERSKTVKSLILKLKSTKMKTKVRESKAKIVEKEKKQSRTLDSYLVAAPSVHHVKKSSVAPQIDEVLRTTESNKKKNDQPLEFKSFLQPSKHEIVSSSNDVPSEHAGSLNNNFDVRSPVNISSKRKLSDQQEKNV